MTRPIKRDKNGRFIKGTVGNKPGNKHRITRFVEKISEAHSKEIVDKIITQALAGDTTLLANFQKVFWAAKRGDFVRIKDLEGDNPMQAILTALATGQITDVQASHLARVIEVTRVSQEVREIKQRLGDIEGGQDEKSRHDS